MKSRESPVLKDVQFVRANETSCKFPVVTSKDHFADIGHSYVGVRNGLSNHVSISTTR